MTDTSFRQRDLTWCSPTRLPGEVLAFESGLRGALPVGAPGKVGLLELRLSAERGVTRLIRHYQRAPLYIYRPVYLDRGRPDMAFIFLQQAGDGLVQGDRNRVDICCGPGSAAHVTTQAATKIYGAQDDFASQIVNLHVEAGAFLEYLPDPVVPFRGSRFFQRTSVVMEPDSSAILGELVLPGRVAHGEKHVYDLYWAETEVTAPDGTLLFADLLALNPAAGDQPNSIGALGPYDVVGTLYMLGPDAVTANSVEDLRRALSGCPGVLAGVSELPNRCGASVRLLGRTSREMQAALRVAWEVARLALLGAPAPNLRKG